MVDTSRWLYWASGGRSSKVNGADTEPDRKRRSGLVGRREPGRPKTSATFPASHRGRLFPVSWRHRSPVSTPKIRAPIPRIALTRSEAAASLGISVESFRVHVQPHVRAIRRGRIVLIPVSELERWAFEASDHTLRMS